VVRECRGHVRAFGYDCARVDMKTGILVALPLRWVFAPASPRCGGATQTAALPSWTVIDKAKRQKIKLLLTRDKKGNTPSNDHNTSQHTTQHISINSQNAVSNDDIATSQKAAIERWSTGERWGGTAIERATTC
jgi:hypothetical protein